MSLPGLLRTGGIVLVLSLAAAACATLPAGLTPESVAEIRAIPVWHMNGRVAASNGGDGWSAQLVWRHDVESDHMAFSGPMQQRAATLLARSGFVSFHSADGRALVGEDADALLREQVGISAPLGALRYWVLGVPAPGVAFAGTDDGFTQAQWRIRVTARGVSGHARLPQRLTMEGPGVKLKLVVDEWRTE